MIPYGQQDIQEDDIKAVIDVLRSDYLTQGPAVPKFEDCLKQYCDVEHAVAVNSATSALHVALLSMNVGQGDIVWTSPNTFVASSNAALYCGALIDFVDINPRTFNMCTDALARKLENAAITNQLPKVIIPVHLTGQPCDMKIIHELSQKYKFYVIEDASHAIGGSYSGKKIGNCAYSDITVFSFHPVKIVTTAEGGAALTNNHEFAMRLKLFRSHGITRDPKLMRQQIEGPWYYEQVELGYNYRMTDLQAALGISQMSRIDTFVRKRHIIAQRYNRELDKLPLTCPYQALESYSAYHLYVILLQLNEIKFLSHKKVFALLREKGIMVNLHYIPVHTQPYYQSMGFRWGDFPKAESYYSEAISLPIYPKLTNKEQTHIIKALNEILKK